MQLIRNRHAKRYSSVTISEGGMSLSGSFDLDPSNSIYSLSVAVERNEKGDRYEMRLTRDEALRMYAILRRWIEAETAR